VSLKKKINSDLLDLGRVCFRRRRRKHFETKVGISMWKNT